MQNKPLRGVRRFIALGGLLLFWMAGASPAFAQGLPTREQPFQIPPQALVDALIQFSDQTGIQVVTSGYDLVDRRTAGVAGTYTAQSALEQLLKDTGLDYRVVGDATVALSDPDAPVVVPEDPKASAVPAEGSIGTADTDPGVKAPGEATTANVEVSRQGGIEEIIVTGQKREERLQDVPIAISAFSMEDLDNQKIEGGFDLLKNVPNVTFSKTNFSGYNFQIRGIGTQAISATTDPGVAVSFNNTTLIVNRLFEQEYLDIERVEVLRGPQGTLYGRNATAGVINVISAKPKLGVYEGELKLETGNYGAERIRGHYNFPLGDEVALRAAYASTKRDGYGYNEYSEVENPFRPRVSADVDDRDLWTGRLTLGWEPTNDLRINLLYERFEEDDRRTRTSKQLCHRDEGPSFVDGVAGGMANASRFIWSSLTSGCKPGSLYADEAFGTPNGVALPYVNALFHAPNFVSGPLGGLAGGNPQAWALGGNPFQGSTGVCSDLANGAPFGDIFGAVLLPIDVCNPDIFRGKMQSRDLRTISSQLEPKYRADSDIYELSFDYQLNDHLLLSSQTVYARDGYWATQDYNRFNAFPIFTDSSIACGLSDPLGSGFFKTVDCSDNPLTGVGSYAGGYYANLSPRPEDTAPTPTGVGGIVCDPQLGCSDTLLIQDLSRAESKQVNQEIRLVSSLEGDWNFSLGANYTSFETMNDYFVFSNTFAHLLKLWPFDGPNSRCLTTGLFCRYVDPNPLESINGDGHNYFRSGNPYKLRSTAMFGELYWQATESLKFTGGLRFTWDRKSFTPLPSQLLLADYRELSNYNEGDPPDICTERITTCPLAGNAPGGRGYVAEPTIVQEWRVPTGRIGFDWKPQIESSWLDQTMVYMFLSRGYKGGGANPPSVARPAADVLVQASGGFVAPRTFKPEYVNAIDIGSKNTLFGGGMTVNLGAFYYDYTDYQISKILDRSAFNENFDATVWGLELETVIAPTPDTLFNASVGYLRTRVADGEESIDLMDRTDGGRRHFANPDSDFPDGFDDWIVLGPWITAASNCIAPRELVEANFLSNTRAYLQAYCPAGSPASATTAAGTAYFIINEDGERELVPLTTSGPTNRGYNPATDAPNGGQGFYKDLSGNELPNAPRFTVSFGGQQTFYLPASWQLTTRVDWYWQDQSYARIYNFEPYDRLKAWTNTNLSIWVEKPEWGLKIETYVKNLFDETPITGAFLNSDDSGLTTNVFTLDPRLFGLSITKRF